MRTYDSVPGAPARYFYHATVCGIGAFLVPNEWGLFLSITGIVAFIFWGFSVVLWWQEHGHR